MTANTNPNQILPMSQFLLSKKVLIIVAGVGGVVISILIGKGLSFPLVIGCMSVMTSLLLFVDFFLSMRKIRLLEQGVSTAYEGKAAFDARIQREQAEHRQFMARYEAVLRH